jgi:hypothetical protein
MPEQALDIANWTRDPPAAWYSSLRDAGYTTVIPQAIDPPAGYPPGVTVPQGQKTLDAGLNLLFYLWLWLGIADPIGDIRRKLDLIAQFTGRVMRLALDVEDNTVPAPDQGGDANRYLDLIEQVLEVLQEYPVILGPPLIYSGPWYWLRWLANTWQFKDRFPAWPADYNGNRDDLTAFEWYGGWANSLYHQHTGTSTVNGTGNVDQSAIDPAEAAAMAAGKPQEPHPHPDANPLLVPMAHMADVLVVDRLNGELARKTAAGRAATPRRATLQDVVSQVATLRTDVLGPRPAAGARMAVGADLAGRRLYSAQAGQLQNAIAQFNERMARRQQYRPAA